MLRSETVEFGPYCLARQFRRKKTTYILLSCVHELAPDVRKKKEQLFPEGGLDKKKTDYGYLMAPVVGKPTNTNQRLNVYVLFLMNASINFRVQYETSHCQSLRVLAKFRKSCFP